MNKFSELTPQVKRLAEKREGMGRINPELYDKYEVKRGLRYKSGRGVLTGLTEIGEVKSYTIDDGEMIPCEGKLYYHGVDIEQIVEGFTKDERFGFEEVIYLLIFGKQPSCEELDENEIKRILAQILFEFPIREIKVDIPSWIVSLEHNHPIKQSVFSAIKETVGKMEKIRQVQEISDLLVNNEYISSAELAGLELGRGEAKLKIGISSELFFKVLSEQTGLDLPDERALLTRFSEMSETKQKLERIAKAYDEVLESGYGIVMPTLEELSLEEPKIIKQSGKYGVKLKATAPSVHLMRVETSAEVTPIVGSEQQSEELVKYLLSEFEEDPVKIWQSDIFGKSVHQLVSEGLNNKLYRMPQDARKKLAETVEKIINDGCNGLICIIL